MKTLGRVVMILLAAAVVIGATWVIGQSSSNTSFTRGERPASADREGRPAPADDEVRAGEFSERGGDHHAAEVFSLRGWLGFMQTIVPITIIIMLVALPMHFRKKRQRARRSEASALPA